MLSALRSGISANATATATVVVRSAGESARCDLFKRALKSIHNQGGAIVDTIVVFNGANVDRSLVRWARRQVRTRCIVLDGPDKAAATYVGRALVRTEFFTYLDDDDELLPGAIAYRVRRMREDPSLDCVATNGHYITPDGVHPVFDATHVYREIGLSESILRAKNWLSSCGGLFRTSAVKSAYFKDLPRHREWTVIAYRLACDLNCTFDDEPTYRIYSTENSQSKRDTYIDASIESLEHMLRYAKDRKHAGKLRRRQSDAHRAICSYYRMRRDFGRAWRSFWRALAGSGGWRHLPYGVLLLMRISRPVEEVLPANFLSRLLRNPRKYFSKSFWGIVLPEVAFRGRMRLLFQLPSALRRISGRRTSRVYVFPSPMGKFLWPEVYVAWKTFAMCDVVPTASPKNADFAIAWHPSTSYEPDHEQIVSLERRVQVLNARCTDIRKSTVGRVFGEVFGYTLEVDPLTYTGQILRKSEKNGAHDAYIFQGPATETLPDHVYQRLVTNATPDGIAEWRVFIVNHEPVAAYTLYAPLHDRFDYHHERGEIARIDETFGVDECRKIRRFNERMGLDFGVLDILRDGTDGRIYISDCNNTPTGPLPTMNLEDQLSIVRTVARAFRAAYLAPARGAKVVQIPVPVAIPVKNASAEREASAV